VRRRDAERERLRDSLAEALVVSDRTIRVEPGGTWVIWNNHAPKVGRFELVGFFTPRGEPR